MLTPEDLQQIVQAISQTDWAQWCQQQMAAQAPAPTPGGAPPAASPEVPPTPEAGAAPDVPAPAVPTTPEAAPPAANGAPPAGSEPPAPAPEPAPAPSEKPGESPPAAPKKDKEPEKLGAGEPRRYEAGKEEDEEDTDLEELLEEEGEEEEGDDDDPEKPAKKDYAAGCKPAKYERTGPRLNYAKVQAHIEKLTSQLHETRQKWSDEVQRRVNAERYGKLSQLRERFCFDLDREAKVCLYERMSEQQFTEHCELIEANYRELGLDADLPVGPAAHAVPPGARQSERYSKDAADKAMRWCEAQAVVGKPFDYGTALAKVHRGEPLE